MDEKIWIENSHLKVGFMPRFGGRVTDIYALEGRSQNRNLLWWDLGSLTQKTGWLHGGMPLVFPFAGWVWDKQQKGAYRLGDEQYSMPIHGFAHSREWAVASYKEDELSLSLTENTENLRIFPFRFMLKQNWRLNKQELVYEVEVENIASVGPDSNQSMPISLGFHPYFSSDMFPVGITTLESEARSFCRVSSEGKAEQEESVAQGIDWDLGNDLHHNAILCNFPSSGAHSALKTKELEVILNGLPGTPTQCMVTWSDLKGKFFCLEPWMGKPDALNASYGIKWLDTGEKMIWSGLIRLRLL